jgi:glutamate-1-semialdehyde aminotransferase|tara:strand:+ start:3190 stop:3372 length:183 start_codon:yes stop_codon:yes gene_type:complete
MQSKGFGDTVEKITKATGIKTIVDRVSEGLNIPCGCSHRKEALNKMFPYKQQQKSGIQFK